MAKQREEKTGRKFLCQQDGLHKRGSQKDKGTFQHYFSCNVPSKACHTYLPCCSRKKRLANGENGSGDIFVALFFIAIFWQEEGKSICLKNDFQKIVKRAGISRDPRPPQIILFSPRCKVLTFTRLLWGRKWRKIRRNVFQSSQSLDSIK